MAVVLGALILLMANQRRQGQRVTRKVSIVSRHLAKLESEREAHSGQGRWEKECLQAQSFLLFAAKSNCRSSSGVSRTAKNLCSLLDALQLHIVVLESLVGQRGERVHQDVVLLAEHTAQETFLHTREIRTIVSL